MRLSAVSTPFTSGNMPEKVEISLRKLFRHKGMKLVAVSLSLCLFIAALSVLLGGTVSPLSQSVGLVSRPFQAANRFLRENVSHIAGQALDYDALLQENQALRDNLAQLNNATWQAQQLQQENDRLRDLLELRRTRQDLTLESARVLGRQSSNWEQTILLDKGYEAGIRAGCCVIDAQGALVGVVTQAGALQATVQLISDAGFQMGGQCPTAEEVGVLKGSAALMPQHLLTLRYLDARSDVVAGQPVTTLAGEGLYPPDLLVGTVERLELEPSAMTSYAVVTPAAELSSLYQVFVVTDFEAEG